MSERRSIAVVGGGIAGVSIAWAVAPDHAVTLLEREPQLAVHATGRSAAILSETSGPPAVCALARASRPFFEAPPPDVAEHDLLSPRGLLWIGRAGDEPALAGLLDVARAGEHPTALPVGRERACRLVPALRPEAIAGGAVHEPGAATIDVAALVAGLTRGARAHGAHVVPGAEVIAARRRPSGWLIETTAGRYEADIIVDAAGAWGDVVATRCGVAPLGLRPLRRTACIVPVEAAVRDWPLVMDVAGRCYFEPEADGLLLSPADEHPSAPGDARPEELDVAWALEMLRETTTLNVRSVRRAWAGLRTFTPDRVPAIGPDPDEPAFVWAVGQGGAGIKTAPAIASVVRAVLTDDAWPDDVSRFGVTAAVLDPARARTG